MCCVHIGVWKYLAVAITLNSPLVIEITGSAHVRGLTEGEQDVGVVQGRKKPSLPLSFGKQVCFHGGNLLAHTRNTPK